MSQDATRPKNLGANAIPSDGYVLTVDGKLKTRYESETEAMAAGSKLKQQFPMIRVSVFEPVGRTYTPVEPRESEGSE